MRKRRILKEMVLLILLAGLAGAISNLARPGSATLDWVGHYGPGSSALITLPVGRDAPAPADPLSVAPHKDPATAYLTVDGDVAARLHKAGAVFIDVRRSDSFKEGHIPGARSIVVWERDADAKIATLQGSTVSLDSVIVIYCSGSDYTDSERLAKKMALTGFRNLYVYRQGFDDWKNRRGSGERGTPP